MTHVLHHLFTTNPMLFALLQCVTGDYEDHEWESRLEAELDKALAEPREEQGQEEAA